MGCQRRLRRIGQSQLGLVAAGCACAVQMLLVAFSRRMYCSLVCSVTRRAGRPASSTETPTRQPGSERRLLVNLDNFRPKSLTDHRSLPERSSACLL
jgi:hypothetical protein